MAHGLGLREIKERQRSGAPGVIAPGEVKITGIEASFEGEEH
jgi:hypothetical protein